MNGTIITSKGIALIAKLIASGNSLLLTRMAVGTGQMPEGTVPAELEGLINFNMNGNISTMQAEGSIATLVCQIIPDDDAQGFVMTEAGVYAKDPDEGEVLYAYLDLSDDPQYIYGKKTGVTKFLELILSIVVGQVNGIDANINLSSIVTKEVMERELAKIEKRYAPIGHVTVNSGLSGYKRWAKIATFKCHSEQDEAGGTLLVAKMHSDNQAYLDRITLRMIQRRALEKGPEVELSVDSPRPGIGLEDIKAVITETNERLTQVELYIFLRDSYTGFSISALSTYGDYAIHSSQEYKDDLPNGMVVEALDRSINILWQGECLMDSIDTINLSEPISKQKSGILLMWRYYSREIEKNGINYTFIPKVQPQIVFEGEVSCVLGVAEFYKVGCKQVTVRDDTLYGRKTNVGSGISNGITYDNTCWKLTTVIGI